MGVRWLGKVKCPSIYPDFEVGDKLSLEKQFPYLGLLGYLQNSELEPLAKLLEEIKKEEKKRLYFHTFNVRTNADIPSFHVMRDLKDAALAIIHQTEGNTYYSRILMENVFLFFRYMIIFERRLTLWKAPTSKDDLKYLWLYSPFFLYRDLWAALLSPYWKTEDEVYADHIRKTIAEYLAQLLPTHPCRVVEHGKSGDWKKCGSEKFCGENNFPQLNCGHDGQLDSVLVAAFAECVCANGSRPQGPERPQQLLSDVMEAVKNHCPQLVRQLWLFLNDWMLDRPKSKDDPPNAIVRIWRKPASFNLNGSNTNNIDKDMAEAYAAARMAAGEEYSEEMAFIDYREWLKIREAQ